MVFAYRHCPDSPVFPFILQRLCWRIEANFYSDTLRSKMMTQRLLAHLRWFEQTIKEQPYDYKWIEDHVFDRALYMVNEYYWNDALRKILLSVAAPRHAAAGNLVRALQLTNVADNLLVTLLDTNSRIRKARSRVTADSVSHLWRHYDYQSPTFVMADTMSVDHLIAYVRQLGHRHHRRPQSQSPSHDSPCHRNPQFCQ